MGTKDGARFLPQQLSSLLAQDSISWDLVVSDDGSSDATVDQLHQFARDRAVTVRAGPRRGFAQNFLSLASQPLNASFLAFCDQDDVWTARKLSRAAHALRDIPANQPALYCSRTVLVDDVLKPIGLSPLFRRRPSFSNALVQCIGGGNTMVMNQCGADLLARFAGVSVVSHDWWAYQLISGAGGKVIYDPQPSLFYRQHGANQSGGNLGPCASLDRAKAVLAGRYRSWLDVQVAALRQAEEVLTSANLRVFDKFQEAREAKGWSCALRLASAGIYRQRLSGQASLLGAALVAAV